MKKKESVAEKVQGALALTQKLRKENKTISNIWFHFNDCDLDEMRKYAKEINNELKFCEYTSKMRLQVFDSKGSTIFVYSKKVKIKNHIVIDTAIKNK